MLKKTASLSSTALLVACALLLSGCNTLFNRISNFWSLGCIGGAIVILDVIALIELAGSVRPASKKILWGLVIVFFPFFGLIAYYFFGRQT